MKDFIKTYKNPNKDKINYDLINRKYDKPLIEYIVDSAKSLEVLKNIEFIGHKFIYYESEIEPIAMQLSSEFTRKLFTRKQRGFGNKIIFASIIFVSYW